MIAAIKHPQKISNGKEWNLGYSPLHQAGAIKWIAFPGTFIKKTGNPLLKSVAAFAVITHQSFQGVTEDHGLFTKDNAIHFLIHQSLL